MCSYQYEAFFYGGNLSLRRWMNDERRGRGRGIQFDSTIILNQILHLFSGLLCNHNKFERGMKWIIFFHLNPINKVWKFPVIFKWVSTDMDRDLSLIDSCVMIFSLFEGRHEFTVFRNQILWFGLIFEVDDWVLVQLNYYF